MTAPTWAPAVEVVGIGPWGRATIGQIETETPARLRTTATGAAIADSDFALLAVDLDDTAARDRAVELLRAATGRTVVFATGHTDDAAPLVDETDLLVPVAAEGPTREPIAGAVADCVECMLPPTVRDLGKGDLAVVAGTDQIARLTTEPLGGDGVARDLTLGVGVEAPDSVLLFFCSEDGLPRSVVAERARERRPDAADYLWDQRVHPRYGDRTHLKRFAVRDASRRERVGHLERV